MSVENMTPDSVVLQQLDGYWMKIATLLLFKLKGRDQVRITGDDMKALEKAFAGGPVLYTHGHADGFSFQVVDEAAAARLAAHDQTMRGTA